MLYRIHTVDKYVHNEGKTILYYMKLIYFSNNSKKKWTNLLAEVVSIRHHSQQAQ